LPGTSQTDAVRTIEACVADTRAWLTINELMINDIKTEFIIIGSRQQLRKVEIDRVGTSDIKPVTSVRNLGVWFDSNMSMDDTHVSRICAKAFFGLYKIRQIHKYLSADVTKTLVHAYVTSHLDYGNSLLVGISGKNIQRLQSVLNSAARVVCLSPKFDHITPHLTELHWLPVMARISFKVLLLVCKALNGMAPSYLADMVRLRRGNRYSLRADTELLLLVTGSFSQQGPLYGIGCHNPSIGQSRPIDNPF
jgi:hypothetical protein